MSEWIEVTWAEVMQADHVRVIGLPDSESVVQDVSSPWRGHAQHETKISQRTGKPYDIITAHEHVDVFIRLAGRPGLLTRQPLDRVELLADDAFHARRLAAMLAAFPTSTPVLPSPAREWNRS